MKFKDYLKENIKVSKNILLKSLKKKEKFLKAKPQDYKLSLDDLGVTEIHIDKTYGSWFVTLYQGVSFQQIWEQDVDVDKKDTLYSTFKKAIENYYG